MNKTTKQIAFFMLLGLIILAIFKINDNGTTKAQLDYSVFLEKVKNSEVSKVRIDNEKRIIGRYKASENTGKPLQGDGYDFVTQIPYNDPELVKKLVEAKVAVEGSDEEDKKLLAIVLNFLPWLLFFVFIWFIMFRQIQGAGNKALAFGKSRAKLNPDLKNKINFNDVAGADEAKEELKEVVEFLKEPKKFISLGAKIPKGVLLVGS
ncbi:MAG TPA: ATP-dependent metallopeptidase FtsH/Yme1/Tma family protein, partial [Spirochaetota bacterium]|nr:ATP-dependent metallopeptidase FtsH/Yme1/Tma family protein [Spirochaetota bacterium]